MSVMQLLNLPVDVWFAIMEHLSLAELAAVHTAFAAAATPVDLSVTKRCAINLISRMLAFNLCRSEPIFSDNGRCYKFRLTNLSAGKCLHGSNQPCGRGYNPAFSPFVNFSRTFHSHPSDTTTTEMLIIANDGKTFDELSADPIWGGLELRNTGPTELMRAEIDFEVGPNEILRFIFNAPEANIEAKFSDVSDSPTCVIRTIAHGLPLMRVDSLRWVQVKERRELNYANLPKEWYEFWSASGLWAVSTFSKEFVAFTHYKSGELVSEWQWKMTSFKTEWKLPIPIVSVLSGL